MGILFRADVRCMFGSSRQHIGREGSSTEPEATPLASEHCTWDSTSGQLLTVLCQHEAFSSSPHSSCNLWSATIQLAAARRRSGYTIAIYIRIRMRISPRSLGTTSNFQRVSTQYISLHELNLFHPIPSFNSTFSLLPTKHTTKQTYKSPCVSPPPS
jgi:hypothetical protein